MVRSVFAFFAVGALVGCSSGEVKIGVDVSAISTAGSSLRTAGVESTPDTPVSSIAINRVRLLVNEVKVGGGGGGCKRQGDTPQGVDSGPFVVNLTGEEIAAGAHREFTLGEVTAGTYRQAEIEIEPLDADASGNGDASGAEFDDFRSSGASLLIDGTFNGKDFQFAGHFKAEQGTEGEVTVDASSPVTIPMAVNPSTWFLDESGNALDPTDPAKHTAIAEAICHTLDTEKSEAGATSDAAAGKRDHRGHEHRQMPHCVEPASP
jgi:hypothetical protein